MRTTSRSRPTKPALRGGGPLWPPAGHSSGDTTRRFRPHPAAGGRESRARESGVRDPRRGRDRTNKAAISPSPQPSPAGEGAVFGVSRFAGEGARAAVAAGVCSGRKRPLGARWLGSDPSPPRGGRRSPQGGCGGNPSEPRAVLAQQTQHRGSADLCVRSPRSSSLLLHFLYSTLSAHGRWTSVSAPLGMRQETTVPLGREQIRIGSALRHFDARPSFLVRRPPS